MNVNAIGNLTRDPEQLGETGCKFSIAHNGRRKENGEWVDHTDYLNIVVFGWRAPSCLNNLTKGRKVHVCGELQVKLYQRKDGDPGVDLSVVAYEVTFLDKRPDVTSSAGGEEPAKSPGDFF